MYTHDLTKLVKTAGLDQQLEAELTDQAFSIYWATAKDWSEQSRYLRTVRLIRKAVGSGAKISGIPFTGNSINGVYIDDAYIYRMM